MHVVIFGLLFAVSLCDSIKEAFQERHRSGNWGDGISSTLCYNIDYLIRLQRTVDYTNVDKIVEIGFGDWQIMNQIHLQGKQYVGYELVDKLVSVNIPQNVALKFINRVQDIVEAGDLLIIKDVLMYLSNADIDYVLTTLLPKYKYALIEISASDADHEDIKNGEYRALKLTFNNGFRVIQKIFKSTRKQTWLIRNK